MGSPTLPAPSAVSGGSRGLTASATVCLGVGLRVLAVAAVLAVAGAWPTPDTNESHYLCKARHSWDPRWCANDFFLESPEAHLLFFRLLGPVADWLPLDAAAWLGRAAGWITLAMGLCTVAAAVRPASEAGHVTGEPHGTGRSAFVPGPTVSALLLAALYSLAVRHTTASGEWVVGGCEGKVFAWGFVLMGAGLFAAGRPVAAWLAIAVATSLHVLVGGWALVAWVGAVAWSRYHGEPAFPMDRRTIAILLLGAALAVAAVLPAIALSRGASAADAAEATRIYVVERLPHHLLIRTFADGLVSRHVLAACLAFCMAAWLPPPRGDATRRLVVFVAMAVAIAVAGCGISLFEPIAPRITYGLLRYYWFRLSDGLVPLLLASTLVSFFTRSHSAGPMATESRPRLGLSRLLPVGAVAVMLAVDLAWEIRHWPLPGRWIASRADRHVSAADWEEACRWIEANTPVDAVFLTPRGSATFQWRTGRAEVVSWKHVPQSLEGILEWRRRIDACFRRMDGGLAASTASLGPARVREVATRYGATWMVVPRPPPEESFPDPPPGRLVHENAGYSVYAITDTVAPVGQ